MFEVRLSFLFFPFCFSSPVAQNSPPISHSRFLLNSNPTISFQFLLLLNKISHWFWPIVLAYRLPWGGSFVLIRRVVPIWSGIALVLARWAGSFFKFAEDFGTEADSWGKFWCMEYDPSDSSGEFSGPFFFNFFFFLSLVVDFGSYLVS